MPSFCAVFGCSNRGDRNFKKSFFRFPSIKNNKGKICPSLVRKKELWLQALKRKDLTDQKLKYARICSDHFSTGKPSNNENDADYVPNLNLGYTRKAESSSSTARRNRRKRKELTEQEQAFTVSQDREDNIIMATTADCSGQGSANSPLTEVMTLEQALLQIDKLKQDLRNRNMEITKLNSKLLNAYITEKSFKDDTKTKFYTGLQSYDCLYALFKKIQPYILTGQSQLSLSPFQQFVATLMRLRLNLKFTDLSYRLNVSRFTISRSFYKCLQILYIRMQSLVMWPDRNILKQTMPDCFKKKFNDKVTIIIDCFEIFIHKSSNLSAQANTWSNYKHHNTIKILIGITPQGTISFISQAYGGRCSDKFITEDCGLLEKLIAGDLILADRGFLIYEAVQARNVDLNIPHFLKGRKQLCPHQVEETRHLANVRIHVERVIGVLREKYNILQNILSMQFITKNEDHEDHAYVDKIIFVCCALVNLCPSVIPDSAK